MKTQKEATCVEVGRRENVATWPPQKYLDVEEAAIYTKSTPASIRAQVHRGQIPYLKRGTRLLFSIAALDAWLTAGSVPVPK